MNIARANQVLYLINEAVSEVESQAERLALLLAECRRERYWEVRGFKREYQWIEATFPDKSLRYIRELSKLGQAYENESGIISDIGPAKAGL